MSEPIFCYQPGSWEATEVTDTGVPLGQALGTKMPETAIELGLPPGELVGGKLGEPVMLTDDRALALGSDPAGGYAVPYQLDGTPVKAKKKGKKS